MAAPANNAAILPTGNTTNPPAIGLGTALPAISISYAEYYQSEVKLVADPQTTIAHFLTSSCNPAMTIVLMHHGYLTINQKDDCLLMLHGFSRCLPVMG